MGAVRSLGWGRLVCPHRAGRERLRRVSLREMNMRSKQGRGALLGLIVTSLLLGALASPSQAQGPRVSRGRHGYALGYRRGYPGGGWGYYPRSYYAPRAGYYQGGSYYGGGLYGQPWGYSHSSGYLPGYGAYFGSSYYGSGFGYSSYGGFCR